MVALLLPCCGVLVVMLVMLVAVTMQPSALVVGACASITLDAACRWLATIPALPTRWPEVGGTGGSQSAALINVSDHVATF